MTVSPEGLAINPGLGDGSNGLLSGETEELANDGGGGNLDENDVVEPDTIEGVLEGKAALDFVSLDHGLKNIFNCGDLDALGGVGFGSTSEPVSDGKDTTKVIRGVTPLGSKPAVIVVKPSNSGTNVEGSTDGVELVRGTWDLGAIGNDCACAIGISGALYRTLCGRSISYLEQQAPEVWCIVQNSMPQAHIPEYLSNTIWQFPTIDSQY